MAKDAHNLENLNELRVSHGDVEVDSAVLVKETADSGMVTSLMVEDVQHSEKVNKLPVLHAEEKSWSQVLLLIKKLESYRDLVNVCKHLILPPLPNDFQGKYDHYMDSIDAITHNLLNVAMIPTPKGFVPVDKIADGNCLSQGLSKIILGTEYHHGQMRVWLIRDGVLNQKSFLNNAHLKIGTSPKAQNMNLVERYCMYSEDYNPCTELTKRGIRHLYRKDWFDFRKLGTFSGVFQLHSAANILQAKVQSYHPDTNVEAAYNDLNWLFYPLGSFGHEDIRNMPHSLDKVVSHSWSSATFCSFTERWKVSYNIISTKFGER